MSFPAEIHCLAIDALRDDLSHFLCALRYPLRFGCMLAYHIFRSVEVPVPGMFSDTNDYLMRLFALITNNQYSIGPLVDSLRASHINPKSINTQSFVSILQELKRHKRLSSLEIGFQSGCSWSWVGPGLRNILSMLSQSNHLKNLSLRNIYSLTLDFLEGANIEYLQLGVDLPSGAPLVAFSTLSTLRSPPPLRTLSITDAFPAVDFYLTPSSRCMSSISNGSFQLSELEIVCNSWINFTPEIRTLLFQSSNSLQRLSILNCPYFSHSLRSGGTIPFDLSQFTKLQYLKVTSTTQPSQSTPIIMLLRSSSTTTSLQEIEIEINIKQAFNIDDNRAPFFGEREYSELEEALLHPHFESIRSVRITHNVFGQMGEEHKVMSKFTRPLAVKKGELHPDVL